MGTFFEKPLLVDTTLREGEQTPGILFSAAEKIEYARRISTIGIREIEVGIPAMGGEEKEAIRKIISMNLPGRILTWNRTVHSDIESSLEIGATSLFISSPVSDLQIGTVLGRSRMSVIESFRNSVRFAKNAGAYVVCGLQDATRADPEYLEILVKTLEDEGADRIRLSDTLGILTPARTKLLVENIRRITHLELEIHTHNDFGLAGANALAAYESGVKYLDGTILGLGERSGNARIEELVLALDRLYSAKTDVDPISMADLCRLISDRSGFPISPSAPIIGENIFAHESGIHVKGVGKDPASYEPFPPELVGAQRKIILGKHSGRNAVKIKMESMGYKISDMQAAVLLRDIQWLASRLGRSLNEDEIREVAHRGLAMEEIS